MMQGSRGRQPLCGANLEARGQNVRLRMGLVMLSVALILCVTMVSVDAPRLWRLVVALPFFMSAMGAYQGLYRTCPGLAAQGCWEVGSDAQRIADPETLAASQRQGRRVLRDSVLTAMGATLLIVVLP